MIFDSKAVAALGTTGFLLAGLTVAATAQNSTGTIVLLPEDVANPAVPVVAPVTGGAKGKFVDLPATFSYRTAPFVDFATGGEVTVSLRGGPERTTQTLLSLSDGQETLSIVTAPASEGRQLSLVLTSTRRTRKSVVIPAALPEQWTPVSLKWTGAKATLAWQDKSVALDLPVPVVPTRIAVLTSRVDELQAQGDGVFRLDWEQGYAATVGPGGKGNQVEVLPEGFDAYFVSLQPGRRDTPALAVQNGSPNPARLTVQFQMKSEVRGQSLNWTQPVEAAGRSSLLVPVKFPRPLTSDIYHLHMECKDAPVNFSADKHFVYVERRAEQPGPGKFGLHDSDRQQVGFWPDALPIQFAHHYARWGYIVGPAWLKDNKGEFGMDPETPSSEWYWNDELDWSIHQGLTPYVCISGDPMQPWMRDKEYEPWKMVKYPFGLLGGKANDARYRQFVRALVQRYKGKVHYYEVQNEPNSHPPGGIPPEDYVALLKAAYEEVHANDPGAQVYGICGTSDFVAWMTKVFELGGYKYMDGVSIHTYTTPKLPEPAGLPAKLRQVQDLIARYKPSLLLLNSETGTYVSPREEVEKPIAADRLTELISKGTPTISVATGWPNYALDEVTGSLSIVRNATYNLAAGAKEFVFFGWNSEWPKKDWWNKQTDAWSIISVTKDGVRTPGLYALAMGVCTAQLESALPNTGTPFEAPGIGGAVFRTTGGGATAVAWSTSGTRTAVFDVQGREVSAVSLFGQPVSLRTSQATRGAVRVELSEQPTYLHLQQGTFGLQPAPISEVSVKRGPNNRYALQYVLANRTQQPWQGSVTYEGPPGWKVEAEKTAFDLAAGASDPMTVIVDAPSRANGQVKVVARVQTPDGDPYTASFALKVRPTLIVTSVKQVGPLTYDQIPTEPQALNRPEQVAIGRPPALASLQEAKYWQGPNELSANVKTAYSAEGLSIAVKVHDANYRPPAQWPGVAGSAVEVFLDFRDQAGSLGAAQYGPGVYQIVLKPPAAAGEDAQIWVPKGGQPQLQVTAEKADEQDYVLNLFLSWKQVGFTPTPGRQFGFDVSVNGPPAGAATRKTQMVLFGTAANSNDASEFGHAVLGEVGK